MPIGGLRDAVGELPEGVQYVLDNHLIEVKEPLTPTFETIHVCSNCHQAYDHEDELNGEWCWACIEGLDVPEMTLLEEACDRWLHDKPFTSFYKWNIKDPYDRAEAATWLAEQIKGVHEVLGK